MRRRISVAAAAAVAATAVMAGCGSSPSSSSPAAAPSGSSSSAGSGASTPVTAGAAVNLAGVCPSTIVVQTDWEPEADHGALYQMLGPDPVINSDKKSVTGDLYAGGKPTGVKLQIRAGGPSIGYETDSAEMYQDKSITLGYVSTDEAIEFSGSLPTTAVFAEDNVSAMVIMWDPKTYPGVTTIKQLGAAMAKKSGSTILDTSTQPNLQYLQASGMIPKSVPVSTYDGTPAKFVEAQGKDAQVGFATAEPYIYQYEVSAWGKPVRYQLIADTGWSPYPEAMSVRTGDLTKLAPCLKKLVPVMQQADVNYFANPTPTNNLIDELVQKYDTGWTYDANVGAYAAKQMLGLGLVGNAGNGYVGAMSASRIEQLIKVATPVFDKDGGHVKAGLVPTDLFTNQFLSKSIGFPS